MNLFDRQTSAETSFLLEGMNPQQKRAICQTEGPLLILAGAGSGKTRVVTHRIAYLMSELGVAPWHILAITFTNKAAREMKERTSALSPFGRDVWISTFHSMCVSILRRHIEALGYDRNFAILDDADQLSALKQVLKSLNIDAKVHPPKYYLARISEAKNQMLLPDEVVPDRFVHDRFIDVYKNYQRLLKTNNRLDFDDLLVLTVRLFEQEAEVLAHYQQKFKYIHVDEYQDTNHAQYKLVRLLAQFHRNLCVVGDSDQSIYSWRGADITNILSFEKDYEEANLIKLEQNYRSTQTILDAANDVIANNPSQYEKRLFSTLGTGGKIVSKQALNGDAEVAYVASEIKSKIAQGASYEDMVVLYRTNSQSRLFEQFFMKQNLPYRLVGGLSYFKRKEIKDLVAFLRLVLDGRDDFSFERIVNVPARGIGATTVGKIAASAAQMSLSMLESIPSLAQTLPRATANKLLGFSHLIETLRAQIESLSLSAFIDLVLAETGYTAMLEAEQTLESASRLENLEEFKTMAVTFENDQLVGIVSQEEMDVDVTALTNAQKFSILLADIALQTDVNSEEEAGEKITLMTIHAAKGLEFKTVFLVGFEDGIFPLYSSIEDGEEALEEERRLAYVAITRAMRHLYITSAKSRMHQGKLKYNKISRFHDEIQRSRLDVQAGDYSAPFSSASAKKPFFAATATKSMRKTPKATTRALGASPAFNTGDKITHTTLGDGVVVAMEGDNVTIAFGAEHGIKKLKAAHPAIQPRQ